MSDIIAKIRKEKPLVHHITNYVTTNESANVTLYWGGLPVMAHFKEEVAAMVESAAALVLNIGVLDDEQVEAMIRAGKKANQVGIPVILDPVGAGATELRTEVAKELMRELDLAVIKGNQGEITVLSGGKAEMSGVESIGKYSKIEQDALNLAQQQEAVIVVSGTEDIVTAGEKVHRINRGHSLMGQVVGTGCMLSSTLGVFCGVTDDYLDASLTAVKAYGIAGEKASQEADRPASYKIALQDTISTMTDEDLIDL